MDSAASAAAAPKSKVIIDQSDMFTHVFSVFEEHKVSVQSCEFWVLEESILFVVFMPIAYFQVIS
jgi:hypothetical protein